MCRPHLARDLDCSSMLPPCPHPLRCLPCTGAPRGRLGVLCFLEHHLGCRGGESNRFKPCLHCDRGAAWEHRIRVLRLRGDELVLEQMVRVDSPRLPSCGLHAAAALARSFMIHAPGPSCRCAPTYEALNSPIRLVLATDFSAPRWSAEHNPPSLVVINRNRCRLAPNFPPLYLEFPLPGDAPLVAATPSLVAPVCDVSTPKELEHPDPYGSWSYPMLVILGTNIGADLTGFMSNDAIRPGPADPAANASACGEGYGPIWFGLWTPRSSDTVPWRVRSCLHPASHRVRRHLAALGLNTPRSEPS